LGGGGRGDGKCVGLPETISQLLTCLTPACVASFALLMDTSRQAGGYRLEPALSHTAPEVSALGTSHVSYTADAFSLGCLLHDCFQLVHLVGPSDVARPLLDLPEYATPGVCVRGRE
jgi:hypothetical protein